MSEPDPPAAPVKILATRRAGADHQVITLDGGGDLYRRTPCQTCPWRKDAVGVFPAEAFRLSAHTGYDVPDALRAAWGDGVKPSTFACHQSGAEKPATCAGFLLSVSAEHNLAVRLRGFAGKRAVKGLSANGHALFADYYDMAVANGVDLNDPQIKPCVRAQDKAGKRRHA